MGDSQVVDAMIHDGLWHAFHNYHMGITGENGSQQNTTSRARSKTQYALAIASQSGCRLGRKDGCRRRCLPVEVP